MDKLGTYVEITHGTDGNFYFSDDTQMMTNFDAGDYWQLRRYKELMKEYVQVVGKGQNYYIRGNVFYGLTTKEKIKLARLWASWHFRNKDKLISYHLD